MDGWYVFNVGRATQWAFADGLEFNPKADQETIGLTIFENSTEKQSFLNHW